MAALSALSSSGAWRLRASRAHPQPTPLAAEVTGDDPRFLRYIGGRAGRLRAENNIKVRFVKGGDTGTALNKAILSKGNPLATSLWGR